MLKADSEEAILTLFQEEFSLEEVIAFVSTSKALQEYMYSSTTLLTSGNHANTGRNGGLDHAI